MLVCDDRMKDELRDSQPGRMECGATHVNSDREGLESDGPYARQSPIPHECAGARW